MPDIGRDLVSYSQVFADAGFTSGQIVFMGASGVLVKDADFTYDPVTELLSVGGNIAFKSGTSFTGTFDHANSANRVYTLPDATGTIVVGGAGSGVIVNADIAVDAGIVYSKLVLTNSILDGDIVSITTRAKLPSGIAYLDEIESITAQWTFNTPLNIGVAQALRTPTIQDRTGVVNVIDITDTTGAVNANSRTWINFVADSPTFSGTTTIATVNASGDVTISKVTPALIFVGSTPIWHGSIISRNEIGTGLQALSIYTRNSALADTERIRINGAADQVDIDILNANLDIGANKLKTTGYNISEISGVLTVQPETSNLAPILRMIPNGTGTNSQIQVYSNNSLVNTSRLRFNFAANVWMINSETLGGGTDAALKLQMKSSDIITINTDLTVNDNSRTHNNFVAASPAFSGTVALGTSTVSGTPIFSGSVEFNGGVVIDTAGLTITDVNVALGTVTGSQWGTAANQKQSWWGVAPVVQPIHIADAAGTLADATTKINAILAQMATTGMQAAA